MIVFVQIDTSRNVPDQLATIARLLDTGDCIGCIDGRVEATASAKAPRKPRAPKVTVPECFDGAPLRAYLRANGPQTIGQLVTAMGGTSEAMRAALDSIGAVKSGKAKGTRYSVPSEIAPEPSQQSADE